MDVVPRETRFVREVRAYLLKKAGHVGGREDSVVCGDERLYQADMVVVGKWMKMRQIFEFITFVRKYYGQLEKQQNYYFTSSTSKC